MVMSLYEVVGYRSACTHTHTDTHVFNPSVTAVSLAKTLNSLSEEDNKYCEKATFLMDR